MYMYINGIKCENVLENDRYKIHDGGNFLKMKGTWDLGVLQEVLQLY